MSKIIKCIHKLLFYSDTVTVYDLSVIIQLSCQNPRICIEHLT